MEDWQSEMGEHLLAGRTAALERATRAALDAGHSARDILEGGMMPAMHTLGERFADGDAFLPDLLLAADTMKGAMRVLEEATGKTASERRGTVVLGTVAGDIHDLGKNLVAMMLKGAGFEVIDLGVDVPPEKFASEAKARGAQLIGMSALLTTTMPGMEKTVKALQDAGVTAKVMVGGAPVTQGFAERIGAHGFAADAASAVDTAKSLVA
jgi:5-methyltetrahydrofolate--homocysteine methyltransferase